MSTKKTNARLIAAAPEMLRGLEAAYIYVLQTTGVLRVQNQAALIAIRDAIATATGRESGTVQEDYEVHAILENRALLARVGAK